MSTVVSKKDRLSPFGVWLDDAMHSAGLNQSRVAEALDISRSAVSRWMKGSTPDDDRIAPLAKLLNRSVDEVAQAISGKPPSLGSPVITPTATVSNEVAPHGRVISLEVRRYDNARASAGHGSENAGGDGAMEEPDFYYIDRVEVEDLIGKGTKPTRPFVVPVEGDSMYPEFLPGEKVVIEPTERVSTDGIHLFRIDDQVFFKRIQRLPNGSYQAISHNDQYPPFIIGPEFADAFYVLGRLWGKYKRYH